MWDFIKKYSYDAVKMLVTQIAIAIFGFVLVLACSMAKNNDLRLICSIGAVVFYLFLIYTMVWEMGAKDSIAVEYGRLPYQPRKGLYIALMANLINWVLAVGIILGFVFSNVSFFSTAGGICASIGIFIQGMFSGILALHVGDTPLNAMPFIYLLTPLPALITAWVGYLLGLKNVKFTKLFDYKPSKK